MRFPLSLKIGLFSALLVAAGCAAIWVLGIWLPAQRERAEREVEYTKAARMLGASRVGAQGTNMLKVRDIHEDLAFVVRLADGTVSEASSVMHADRFGLIDHALALQYPGAPAHVLGVLAKLKTGERPGLVVKRVNLEGTGEALVLGFSTRRLDDELRGKLRVALQVSALAVALSILGALLLGRAVSRPVRALAQAMDRIGKGSYQPVRVTSGDEVGLLARSFNGMVQGLKERERLRGTLARYVSDDVAERILTEQSDLDLKGELREVTVLFLDIRGFTSLSERMPPREVVAMLNEYFEIIIEVMFRHHGTINKFIGDAIMAIYGAPQQIDDPAMRAVRTAVEIEQQVALHNARRRQAGQQVISIGIGINTGLAIAGNIGSERRMEYTVIGDEVNLAQRLEGLAREGEVLISQATFDRVKERVDARARDPMPVKGKSLPVRVFEVVGLRA